MRVLVTGSQGVLGTRLVTELRTRGHEVTATARRHGIRCVRMDVTEWGQVDRTFRKVHPEVCVHLAGEFGRRNGQDYPEQLWRSNCLGTHNMIAACTQHGTRLIFASSSEAYGDLAELGPLLAEDLLDEDAPLFLNEYALTKYTNELQIDIGVRQHGLNAVILRFFNVYGPGEHYTPYRSVIAQFIYQALFGSHVTVYCGTSRSFLYIDDWAHVVANVCDTPTPTGEAFNIASPTSYMMDVVWEIVKEATNTKLVPWLEQCEPQNVQDKHADISKAARTFNLQDTIDLREGIARTVAWQRSVYGC